MSLLTTKSISMYHSKKESDYAEFFHKYMKCDVVYSKKFEGGTLYCLIHTNPHKSHRTLDNALSRMEFEIDPDNTNSTFHSISEEMSMKVVTFNPMEHMTSKYYGAIFAKHGVGGGGERVVFEDVNIWEPAAHANIKKDHVKQLEERVKKTEAKAAAWDKHEDYLSTAQLKEAMKNLKTPMEKLIKMAEMAGICVRCTDTYKQLKRKVVLVTHPDKRKCDLDKDMLFEKICKTVNDLPSNDDDW